MNRTYFLFFQILYDDLEIIYFVFLSQLDDHFALLLNGHFTLKNSPVWVWWSK